MLSRGVIARHLGVVVLNMGLDEDAIARVRRRDWLTMRQ